MLTVVKRTVETTGLPKREVRSSKTVLESDLSDIQESTSFELLTAGGTGSVQPAFEEATDSASESVDLAMESLEMRRKGGCEGECMSTNDVL